MDYATVNYAVTEKGIAVITFNRPEQMNAVNEQMMTDMAAACRTAQADDAVKLVVITGAGRGFSSGGDLDMIMNCKTPVHAKDVFDGFGAMALAIYEITKPVIAAVNGTVAGASMAPLMACDIILATDKVRFGYTFTSVGLCPDNGTSYFLVQKVGYHRAAEILWEGRILSAQEAYELNMVNRILPADNFMAAVMDYAE
ncbi:MAG: enoyl-CoA hydratase/isomerase family protein, partial [Syntrophomonadaceae bacterium]|nr:enoyl-CoA hydratase/isomerase family protein [Syntrophomonadaceae bacterium]